MLVHNRGNIRALQAACPAAGDKNKIEPGTDSLVILRKSGANDAPRAVTLNRAANFFSGCDTETAKTRTVFQNNRNQCRILI